MIRKSLSQISRIVWCARFGEWLEGSKPLGPYVFFKSEKHRFCDSGDMPIGRQGNISINSVNKSNPRTILHVPLEGELDWRPEYDSSTVLTMPAAPAIEGLLMVKKCRCLGPNCISIETEMFLDSVQETNAFNKIQMVLTYEHVYFLG
jgi:hypothetical protein